MGTGSGQAVLELEGVQLWYGDGAAKVDVLHGVDLSVRAGQTVAIVGPSGSGKSTLLHVAGLLDAPDKGQVKVMGVAAAGRSDAEISAIRNAHFGFVYQYHHLLREFDARENVMMPALIGGKGERRALKLRAEELLKAVGLGKRVEHYPHQMSGGEQQRVALARALMNWPKLLLADEPTGNLDPHTAESVVDLLFGLVRNEGLSALIVTHNVALAERCDVILRMEEGRLV
ncbi:MAG: ATP-binding cassette domain-containing protein [Proteobacteria bacterium]|nr:ATP-binding cassette domain-containing protein [Pseudomonadota bacterium]